MEDIPIPEHSIEAIRAAALAQESVEKARQVQLAEAIKEGLDNYFNRGTVEKRFIDVGRIPFLCDDVRGIHAKLETMATDSNWTKRGVLGLYVLIGTISAALILKALYI